VSETKEYLGDSVYVELVGSMLKLTTNNGANDSNVIYLEMHVYRELVQYVDRLQAKWSAMAKEEAL
jgi:predicted DNA-binding protein (UPF0278 family)